MAQDDRLRSDRFPRSNRYHPDWILSTAAGGSCALWLTEWLTSVLDLRPGMRVLDLGCGKAASSVFLAAEFDVQVWATDLWTNATENALRIEAAGLGDRVFPIHADARSLPFAAGFFDVVVCVDAYPYFGTDDLYLNYLAHFVRPGGQVAIAGAGLTRELAGAVPDHLLAFWTQDAWCLHSAGWWRRHWGRTGLLDIETAETMPDGWRVWLDWQRDASLGNAVEISTLEQDRGDYLGYTRIVGRRRSSGELQEYCWPDPLRVGPVDFEPRPLLRSEATGWVE
ncbi:MAG: SAM-dependent methyltransferase [Actinomycetota bacterium]